MKEENAILQKFSQETVPGPDLKCQSSDEMNRIINWLVASGVAFGWTHSERTVRLLKPAPKLTPAQHNAFPNGRWS